MLHFFFFANRPDVFGAPAANYMCDDRINV
jgi:hypothetical protein